MSLMSKGEFATLERKSGLPEELFWTSLPAEICPGAAGPHHSFLTLPAWLSGSVRALVLPIVRTFGSDFP